MSDPPGQTSRTLALVVALAVLTSCGVGAVLVYRHWQGQMVERTVNAYRATGLPWEAKEVVVDSPSENSNAADWLLGAIRALDRKRFSADRKSLGSLAKQGPRSAFLAKLRPYQESLVLAALASKSLRLDFHRDWDRIEMLSHDEGASVQNLVWLFCLRAESEVPAQVDGEALGDLQTAAQLSALIGQDPLVLSLLEQYQSDTRIYEAVERIAFVWRGHQEGLWKLKAIVDSMQPLDLPRAMRGAAYTGIAIFRNYNLAQIEEASGSSTAKHVPPPTAVIHSGIPTGRFERQMAIRYLEIWTELGTILQKSPHDSAQFAHALERIEHGFEMHKDVADLLDAITLPLSNIDMLVLTDEARARTMSALLAAMEVKARTGKFPLSLDELPGKWIDPFNGEPLKYKLTADGLRIYSVGENLKDDGGIARNEIGAASRKDYDEVASYPPIKTRQ